MPTNLNYGRIDETLIYKKNLEYTSQHMKLVVYQ